MKNHIVKLSSILLLTIILALPAIAVQVKQLGWEDLVKKVAFEDPFEALTDEQLSDLGFVARVRSLQANGRNVGENTLQEARTATRRLEDAGIDIDDLMAKRAEIRELRKKRAHAVVPELDGRQVRMPGYALPLEYRDKKITEFLLVPWVGACIHTPPPPPNQIVYVKAGQGIESHGRFTPVWVTGEITVKAATKNLYLVDGSSGIDVGYSLEADIVEQYNK